MRPFRNKDGASLSRWYMYKRFFTQLGSGVSILGNNCRYTGVCRGGGNDNWGFEGKGEGRKKEDGSCIDMNNHVSELKETAVQ